MTEESQPRLRPRSFADLGTPAEDDTPRDERYQRLYEYALSLGNSPKAAHVFADTRLSTGLELQADELIQEGKR